MSFQSNGGGALFTGQLSYAVVHNNNGQTFVPDTPAILTIDTVEHLSSDFAATVGDTKLFAITPGIYLAVGDTYAFSAALATGRIDSAIGASGSSSTPFGYRAPCDAINTDVGYGLGVEVAVMPGAGTYFSVTATQTDTVDRVLGGDLFVVRLGDLPS